MGAQVLCGLRVAFQKFTLRQSELLHEVVHVVFRTHLDHLHYHLDHLHFESSSGLPKVGVVSLYAGHRVHP
jgi:hypothetical protein